MRVTNRKIYVSALFLTIVIFVMGLLLGLVIEGKRVAYVENADRIQKLNFESLQLQFLYLASLEGRESCPAFSAALGSHIKETEKVRERLEGYIASGVAYNDEFEILKREYTISQLNYWILSKKTKRLCGTDFIPILYFYSDKCPECENQGFVLDYVKKRFGDRVLIFALDRTFREEPIIPVIVTTYNVSSSPTIVVEDDVFTGFQSKDALLEAVCGKFTEKPSDCP
ncbi:MAG: hypothetical protein ABH834_05630 [Candidatus Altiarchaeota archaeon]